MESLTIEEMLALGMNAFESDGYRGVKFSPGATSGVAFKGPNVILGLYKCNYSLTVKGELSTAAG